MPSNKPEVDEIEVSVFGPGYGESILLHIGNNEWIIVDSCVDRGHQEPAALGYLKKLGVDPEEDVKLVVATHWHDDHIRGLGKIVEECESADFVCSTAIKAKEFLKLMEVHRHRQTSSATHGVCEFLKIFDTLKKRDTPPKFAIADRTLWRRPSSSSTMPDCSVHSLSPSDSEIEKALISLSELFPEEGTHQGRLSAPKPNECAVVLWIGVGDEEVILLGADLEESGNPKTGWSAIVKGNSCSGKKASIYKVAHHGSITGHYEPIWTDMLIEKPWALLTPFSRGSIPLPTENDIKRISNLTPNSYITAQISKEGIIKRNDTLVKKCLKQYTRYIKVAEPMCGHIRMRRCITSNGNWNIELHGGAAILTQ